MPTDPNRDALDRAYTEGTYRIGEEFDGVARPAPAPPAPPPPPVKPGGFASEPAAPLEVKDEGPGFFSRLWDGVKTVAPVAADAYARASAAKAPLGAVQPAPGLEVPQPPQLPAWAPWAAVLGILAVVLYLLRDD